MVHHELKGQIYNEKSAAFGASGSLLRFGFELQSDAWVGDRIHVAEVMRRVKKFILIDLYITNTVLSIKARKDSLTLYPVTAEVYLN